MQKPRVYVETSIPSFYHELRTTPDVVARRDWTRKWWNEAPAKYELLTSPAVINELSAGIPERSAERLSLIRGLLILPIEPAIADIAMTTFNKKSCRQTQRETHSTWQSHRFTNAIFW